MKRVVVISLAACGLVFALGTWAMASVGQRGAGARQAWEYKTLMYTTDEITTTFVEDGKPATGTPVGRAPQLGADGWELTGMTAVPNIRTNLTDGRVYSTSTFVYWFKRPR